MKMENEGIKKMTKIRDWHCDRHRLLDMLQKLPNSNCVTQREMTDIRLVEALSEDLSIRFGFSLIHVSTKGAMRFIRIKDDDPIKPKVLRRMRYAILSLTNPFTGRPLGYYGISDPIIEDLIELERTGKVGPKPTDRRKLSASQIIAADLLRQSAMAACKSEAERETIVRAYNKLRGFPETRDNHQDTFTSLSKEKTLA